VQKLEYETKKASGCNHYMNHKYNLSVIGLVQIVAVLNFSSSILTIFDGASRYFELFSHFKVQYLIVSMICFIVFYFYKNYKSCLAMALAAIINAAFIVPWYIPPNDHFKNQASINLKILHSNVHTSNVNYRGFVDYALSESPDLIIAQEVNRDWLKNLESLKSTYPYFIEKSKEDNFGIAIFSRHPFDESKILSFGESALPGIKVSFKLSGQQITLLSVHPPPPISTEYFLSRNLLLNEIAQIANTIKTPLIMVGDLNVSLWSSNYTSLEYDSQLINARKGFGILPTWPTILPLLWIPIDHCLISHDFFVENIKTGKDIGSDHFPLVITLKLKGNKNTELK
jgi:endonuclease/exonuclease/phosphatase (EEP) superfamily protein YafD